MDDNMRMQVCSNCISSLYDKLSNQFQLKATLENCIPKESKEDFFKEALELTEKRIDAIWWLIAQLEELKKK